MIQNENFYYNFQDIPFVINQYEPIYQRNTIDTVHMERGEYSEID
jgi:hypothetical protein